MKKFIALLLCLLTVMTVLASCNKNNTGKEDKGPTIPVYISTEIANFDPAYANLDDASIKILSLIYEGLFKIDANGKVVKSHAKSVKVLDKPEDDYYAIEITLKNTCWSDGTRIQAADYVFAWKRILESEFRGEAANMLLGIKNARAVNAGDASIDDLGVTDEAIDILRIEFEGPTNYDVFYEYLASPMLVPLRESSITKVKKDWSSNASVLVCNGPFLVRSYLPGKKLVLERNLYYYRNVEKDSVAKHVYPYRLAINFDKNASENLADFEAGALTYISELPLDKRAAYKDQATVVDTQSILSCLFNTKVAPFDNADVRNALSLALDRNKIVNLLTFAKPAEGLIASGVYNAGYAKKATTFREAGQSLIAPSADVAKAKDLLKKASVSGGEIEITLRNNEVDLAVAEYIKGVWTSLGFTVTLDVKKFKGYMDDAEYDLVADPYLEAYDAADFQVILVDHQMLTTDAFPNLAMFAKSFACGKMDMNVSDDSYELATHISGYDNAAYDAKIEEAFAATDRTARAALLHEAEAILMTDMPIAPLVQLQSAILVGEDLGGLKSDFWGLNLFQTATLNNRSKYEETKAPAA